LPLCWGLYQPLLPIRTTGNGWRADLQSEACPLVADRQFHVRKTIYPSRRATKQAGISTSPHTTITDSNETATPEPLVRGSKTEYDKFQDADASYQDRESYKIVVEPMLIVYVHECPPESPAQGKIGTSWLAEGKRVSAIHF
jgi:hypothetical protein